MKHAGTAALAVLHTLLTDLRAIPALVEKRPGIFYLRQRAFLHFHEDPAGLVADARLGDEGFERFPGGTPQEQQALLENIARRLAPADADRKPPP